MPVERAGGNGRAVAGERLDGSGPCCVGSMQVKTLKRCCDQGVRSERAEGSGASVACVERRDWRQEGGEGRGGGDAGCCRAERGRRLRHWPRQREGRADKGARACCCCTGIGLVVGGRRCRVYDALQGEQCSGSGAVSAGPGRGGGCRASGRPFNT